MKASTWVDCGRREFLALGAAPLLQDAGYAVHEWGIVSVPDGSSAAGLRTGGEGVPDPLPAFVQRPLSWEEFERLYGGAYMKKPVVYFHSDRRLKVQLTVRHGGGIQAWWPPAETSAGSLRWSLTVEPAEQPLREATGWWPIARKAGSAYVVADGEAEKFVFYEATLAYDPRLRISWKENGDVEIANVSKDTYARVFAVRVKDGVCASAAIPDLAPGGTARTPLAEGEPALGEALRRAGLTGREADAVVEIWTPEFFKTDGVRVLALAPAEVFDRLAPMELDPAPRERVRVLVAHVESLDDEGRRRIRDWIRLLGSDEPEDRDGAAAKLRGYGPLARPFLREAELRATDPERRARVRDLLVRPPE